MDKLAMLRNVPAFAPIADDHLAWLARDVVVQSYDRGEIILLQGSNGSTLYVVVRGQVRIYTVGEQGQELSVSILCPGEFFGELALLDGRPRSASAEAMCPTTTLALHRHTFLQMLAVCPPVAVAILEALAARLRASTANADRLAHIPASRRVLRHLVDLAAHEARHSGVASGIDLRLTQDELASLSGTTRETVNRVLAGLRGRGMIRVERGGVSVLDLHALSSLLQDA